jgi:hypothetical protein
MCERANPVLFHRGQASQASEGLSPIASDRFDKGRPIVGTRFEASSDCLPIGGTISENCFIGVYFFMMPFRPDVSGLEAKAALIA